MAAVANLGPVKEDLTTVYIVLTGISSGSNIEDREQIDDLSEKVTHVFTKEVRQKISATRSKFYGRIVRQCLSFHERLLIARKDQLDDIAAIIREAHVELQAIHPTLTANVEYVPLAADEQKYGALYNAIVNAIREQIFKILLPRLKSLAGQTQVPKRSRLALLDLCDKMDTWNVVGDARITQTVAEFRRQFENDIIAPVAAEVEQELRTLTGPAAFVELPADAPKTAPEATETNPATETQ